MEDLEAALEVLAGGQHDWRETAVVEVDPNSSYVFGNPQSGAIVDFVEYEPDAIKTHVQTDATGWLLLIDQRYPGWQAMGDRQPDRIQTTNAVRLTGVVLLEMPRRYKNGKVVSGCVMWHVLASKIMLVKRLCHHP